MLHNRAEDWEVKAHQAEGESSSVRLELLSIDTERRHLRERVELLEKEIQEVIYIYIIFFLYRHNLVKQKTFKGTLSK